MPVTQSFDHTERIWWLLAPNPALIVPDVVAAHDNPPVYGWWTDGMPLGPTLVTPIAEMLSSVRVGPYIDAPKCSERVGHYTGGYDSGPSPFYRDQQAHQRARVGDSWYLGLLANLAFGGIGLIVAARRLRVPAGKLPKGVRIA
ncbi:MAG: hypothetical protein CME34_05975 [Gordonia sp.]|nr:hypothetical protein [Gordonia sp. (in: high G+C Gram-positive bacteria)]